MNIKNNSAARLDAGHRQPGDEWGSAPSRADRFNVTVQQTSSCGTCVTDQLQTPPAATPTRSARHRREQRPDLQRSSVGVGRTPSAVSSSGASTWQPQYTILCGRQTTLPSWHPAWSAAAGGPRLYRHNSGQRFVYSSSCTIQNVTNNANYTGYSGVLTGFRRSSASHSVSERARWDRELSTSSRSGRV